MKGFFLCNPKALMVTKVIGLFIIITVALSSFAIGLSSSSLLPSKQHLIYLKNVQISDIGKDTKT